MDNVEKVEEIRLGDEPDSMPNTLLQLAITQQLPIEHLERLMQLKERWDKQQAKQAFDEAMAKFQSKCPIIKKAKEGGKTKDGFVAYRYAPIEAIVEQTKDLVAECGFSYLIKTNMTDTTVEVSCEVRHILGHSETSTMKVPLLRQTGVMSEAQVVAGTSTFAKRYAFCNAFGIMTADDDNDGISETMTDELEALVKEWDYPGYIQEVANTIMRGSAFRQFLDSLPTSEQVTKFKQLLKLIPEKKHLPLWKDFSKLTNKTAPEWLTRFEGALKTKE